MAISPTPQVHGPIVWPGDIDASLTRHGETVTTPGCDTYGSVGGLPAAVVAGSSLGPSGYPFFAADTGGYRNSPPSKETFLRWMAQSAFTPVMQVGTNSNEPRRASTSSRLVLDPKAVPSLRAAASPSEGARSCRFAMTRAF